MLNLWRFAARKAPPRLTTARLGLRLLQRRDTASFARYAGDPQVARWMFSFPSPYPRYRARARIRMLLRQYVQGQALPLAIETREQHYFLGVAVLFIQDEGRRGELAYWIARPFWRRGYGHEAVAALMAHAQSLGIEQLSALVISGNQASSTLLKNLGFRLAGTQKEPDRLGRDILLMRYHIDFLPTATQESSAHVHAQAQADPDSSLPSGEE